VAGTLIFQSWQFIRSEADKREDALDVQWQGAVKIISEASGLPPSLVMLQQFLRVPKYHEQATAFATNLLVSSSDPVVFTSLFGTALTPTSWSNVDRLLRLDRALRARMEPLDDRSWDQAKQDYDTTRLTKDELSAFDYVMHALPVITAQIGGVLKTPRPPGVQIDFVVRVHYLRGLEGHRFGRSEHREHFVHQCGSAGCRAQKCHKIQRVGLFQNCLVGSEVDQQALTRIPKDQLSIQLRDTVRAA
jgi:hypothetical protein